MGFSKGKLAAHNKFDHDADEFRMQFEGMFDEMDGADAEDIAAKLLNVEVADIKSSLQSKVEAKF